MSTAFLFTKLVNGFTLLAGSEAAKATVYSKYKSEMEKIISTFVKDKEIAKDLTADTFVKAFNSIESYSSIVDKVPFKHWLVRLSSNTARDYLRSSQAAFRKKAISEEEKKVSFNSMASSSTPDKDAEAAEIAERVNAAIQKIPQEYQSAIKAFYFEGLSVKEIAKRDNISTSGVSARLKRGKEALKNFLSSDLFKAISPYLTQIEVENNIDL